jgi:hypothetical protein
MIGHIDISDINEALPRVLPMLLRHGVPMTADSIANQRPTVEWPGLFVTHYWRPQRNVLFDPVRDANPFFHYLEAMWIIDGRDDVEFLAHVLPNMKNYSDDGRTFHGAYGHRLRHWLGAGDQIEQAISILADKPASRQVVMSIWNPATDLGAKTKDMPCNDMIMLKVREGRLNLTVSNRSNDVIWGCYGANVVQFSMLQMYMAARLGLGVGAYHQVSDSFHVYEDTPYWNWFKAEYAKDPDHWAKPLHQSRCQYAELGDGNLFEQGIESFDGDIKRFFDEAMKSITGGNPVDFGTRSMAVRNAVHIWNGLLHYRAGRYSQSREELGMIESPDWRTACEFWLERRMAKKATQ